MKRISYLIVRTSSVAFSRIEVMTSGSALLMLLLITGFPSKLTAQTNQEGLFLTPGDFRRMKISYGHDHAEKNYHLNVNRAFGASTIKIVTCDSTIRMHKDSVFGYRDKHNSCYRFYQREEYKVLNPSEKMLLYRRSIVTGVPRNIRNVFQYYFSENPGSPIYPLTCQNLKMVLPKEVVFHIQIDTYFHSDAELMAYDKVQGRYLLNRIHEDSKIILSKINQ